MDNVVMIVVLGVLALGALWLLYYALFSKKIARPKREDEPELHPIPEKRKKGEMNMVGIQKWLQIAVTLATLAVLFWGVLTLNGINQQLTNMTARRLPQPFRTSTSLWDIESQLSSIGSGLSSIESELSDIESELSSLYEIERQLSGIEFQLSWINKFGIDIK